MTQYVTKDSGERAEFDSGMKRDTETGKPRFDLLRPLNVPYEDQFLTRVAALLGRGAEKYDERNWEKADSEAELARMKSSAARHFEQWLNGETDEDHAAATVFNLLAHETTAYKMAVTASDPVDWCIDTNRSTDECAADGDCCDDDLEWAPAWIPQQQAPFLDPSIWENMGYIDNDAVPEVFVKWGEPQTITFEAKSVSEEAIRAMIGFPAEPPVFRQTWICGVDPADEKFEPFDQADIQPIQDAINASVKRLADLALVEEFHLHDVAFVASADEVTDIRQAVHNALNRRG